jgi:hypothetical protein
MDTEYSLLFDLQQCYALKGELLAFTGLQGGNQAVSLDPFPRSVMI